MDAPINSVVTSYFVTGLHETQTPINSRVLRGSVLVGKREHKNNSHFVCAQGTFESDPKPDDVLLLGVAWTSVTDGEGAMANPTSVGSGTMVVDGVVDVHAPEIGWQHNDLVSFDGTFEVNNHKILQLCKFIPTTHKHILGRVVSTEDSRFGWIKVDLRILNDGTSISPSGGDPMDIDDSYNPPTPQQRVYVSVASELGERGWVSWTGGIDGNGYDQCMEVISTSTTSFDPTKVVGYIDTPTKTPRSAAVVTGTVTCEINRDDFEDASVGDLVGLTGTTLVPYGDVIVGRILQFVSYKEIEIVMIRDSIKEIVTSRTGSPAIVVAATAAKSIADAAVADATTKTVAVTTFVADATRKEAEAAALKVDATAFVSDADTVLTAATALGTAVKTSGFTVDGVGDALTTATDARTKANGALIVADDAIKAAAESIKAANDANLIAGLSKTKAEAALIEATRLEAAATALSTATGTTFASAKAAYDTAEASAISSAIAVTPAATGTDSAIGNVNKTLGETNTKIIRVTTAIAEVDNIIKEARKKLTDATTAFDSKKKAALITDKGSAEKSLEEMKKVVKSATDAKDTFHKTTKVDVDNIVMEIQGARSETEKELANAKTVSDALADVTKQIEDIPILTNPILLASLKNTLDNITTTTTTANDASNASLNAANITSDALTTEEKSLSEYISAGGSAILTANALVYIYSSSDLIDGITTAKTNYTDAVAALTVAHKAALDATTARESAATLAKTSLTNVQSKNVDIKTILKDAQTMVDNAKTIIRGSLSKKIDDDTKPVDVPTTPADSTPTPIPSSAPMEIDGGSKKPDASGVVTTHTDETSVGTGGKKKKRKKKKTTSTSASPASGKGEILIDIDKRLKDARDAVKTAKTDRDLKSKNMSKFNAAERRLKDASKRLAEAEAKAKAEEEAKAKAAAEAAAKAEEEAKAKAAAEAEAKAEEEAKAKAKTEEEAKVKPEAEEKAEAEEEAEAKADADDDEKLDSETVDTPMEEETMGIDVESPAADDLEQRNLVRETLKSILDKPNDERMSVDPDLDNKITDVVIPYLKRFLEDDKPLESNAVEDLKAYLSGHTISDENLIEAYKQFVNLDTYTATNMTPGSQDNPVTLTSENQDTIGTLMSQKRNDVYLSVPIKDHAYEYPLWILDFFFTQTPKLYLRHSNDRAYAFMSDFFGGLTAPLVMTEDNNQLILEIIKWYVTTKPEMDLYLAIEKTGRYPRNFGLDTIVDIHKLYLAYVGETTFVSKTEFQMPRSPKKRKSPEPPIPFTKRIKKLFGASKNHPLEIV